jgi:hypothetical protein
MYCLNAPIFLYVVGTQLYTLSIHLRSSCFMCCSHVTYTPYSGKRCWWRQSRLSSGMSIMRRGFYAVIKLIFIHSSTNSIQRQRKNVFMHLDNWLYASNWPSRAMIQISNLWIFIFFKKIFKVDLESCTKNVRSSMVKTVFESDALFKSYYEKDGRD